MSAAAAFWWVRHAPVVGYDGRRYGALDVDCDVSDKDAFRALRALLPDAAVVATSGLVRARKTADAVVAHGLRPLGRIDDPRLGEQSFGEWQGRPLGEVERAARTAGVEHPHWILAPEGVPPGGESFLAMAERVARASEDLLRSHASGEVVVVSHGGPIRAACARDPGWDLERALALTIPNLSVTRIEGSLDGAGAPSWRVDWTGRTGA